MRNLCCIGHVAHCSESCNDVVVIELVLCMGIVDALNAATTSGYGGRTLCGALGGVGADNGFVRFERSRELPDGRVES